MRTFLAGRPGPLGGEIVRPQWGQGALSFADVAARAGETAGPGRSRVASARQEAAS